MRIHEYQAKALLARFGIPIPRGEVATTPSQAGEIAAQLGGRAVVKAQLHAGGRGKAGGIRLVSAAGEAEMFAKQLLGAKLTTHQTPPQGLKVNQVLVEEALAIEQELYLGILVDVAARLPLMIASPAGGMDIEEIARQSPEKIVKTSIDPTVGFQPFQGRKLAYAMNLEPGLLSPVIEVMSNLYRLFWTYDCSLAEINPLVITSDQRLLALDAKLTFDDNALFRHPDIAQLRDPEQEDPLEVAATGLGIRNYIKLDGDIGCMVNGAGLAMAVLDIITQAGGRPANFLDIGTANTPDRVVNAFKIFTADPAVKAVLVNIFGGVARTDVIARGIVEAHKQMDIPLPLIVRLAGTNLEEAERILGESGLSLIRASSLRDAAEKAVDAAKKSRP